MDPVLLTHFLVPSVDDKKTLDFGAGCGIISLILAYRHPGLSISAIELQSGLADIASYNIVHNHLSARLNVIHGDLRRITSLVDPGGFDLVYSNPPYASKDSSRINKEKEKAVARHEVKLSMIDVVGAASFVLREEGRAAFIYPYARAKELIRECEKNNLQPSRMQDVYSFPGGPVKRVLLEAKKGGRGQLRALPPFYIFASPGGVHSEEMARLYRRNLNPQT